MSNLLEIMDKNHAVNRKFIYLKKTDVGTLATVLFIC